MLTYPYRCLCRLYWFADPLEDKISIKPPSRKDLTDGGRDWSTQETLEGAYFRYCIAVERLARQRTGRSMRWHRALAIALANL